MVVLIPVELKPAEMVTLTIVLEMVVVVLKTGLVMVFVMV